MSWRGGRIAAAAIVAAVVTLTASTPPLHARSRAATEPVAGAAKIWFAPLPSYSGPQAALGYDGSKDFMRLFAAGAPWKKAASHVEVFKLYASWVLNDHGPGQLRRVVQDLARRRIALAVETGALKATSTCGRGIEGYNEWDISLDIAREIAAAGGTLAYVALDSPFYEGTVYSGPGACHYSPEEDARQVAEFARGIHAVFPHARVGDIEALTPDGEHDGVASLIDWLDTYKRVTGSRLPFLHIDMGYNRPNWPADAKELEAAARARGIPFGLIYDGEGDSDAEWTATSERRFATYESEYGGRPDQIVLQSWADHPDYVLPESRRSTFTWLIDRYTRPRTTLSLRTRESGDGLSTGASGRLAIGRGRAIGGAKIVLSETPTAGDGLAAAYTISGTVPAGATAALVGYRVGHECGCSGTSDFALESAAYADGLSRRNPVPDPSFDEGSNPDDVWPWDRWGEGGLEPDGQGGMRLHVTTAVGQIAGINSGRFAVKPGSRYSVTFQARVAPRSAGSGYFTIIFLRGGLGGIETARRIIPLRSLPVSLGTAITTRSGTFATVVHRRLPADDATLAARYAGSGTSFPAFASVPASG